MREPSRTGHDGRGPPIDQAPGGSVRRPFGSRINGSSGCWVKSNSLRRSPSTAASSRVVGRIRPSPVPPVQPPRTEEPVFDQLEVGVEGQRLIVDAGPDPRADHDPRDAEPVPVLVDRRRPDVVVGTTPVVPRQGDRRVESPGYWDRKSLRTIDSSSVPPGCAGGVSGGSEAPPWVHATRVTRHKKMGVRNLGRRAGTRDRVGGMRPPSGWLRRAS